MPRDPPPPPRGPAPRRELRTPPRRRRPRRRAPRRGTRPRRRRLAGFASSAASSFVAGGSRRAQRAERGGAFRRRRRDARHLRERDFRDAVLGGGGGGQRRRRRDGARRNGLLSLLRRRVRRSSDDGVDERVCSFAPAFLVARRERRREHRVHALRGGVEPSRDVQKDSALPSRRPRLRDDVFLVRRMVSFSVRGFRLLLPEKPVVAIRRRGIRARGDEPAETRRLHLVVPRAPGREERVQRVGDAHGPARLRAQVGRQAPRERVRLGERGEFTPRAQARGASRTARRDASSSDRVSSDVSPSDSERT